VEEVIFVSLSLFDEKQEYGAMLATRSVLLFAPLVLRSRAASEIIAKITKHKIVYEVTAVQVESEAKNVFAMQLAGMWVKKRMRKYEGV
jgi:hypothetical protein